MIASDEDAGIVRFFGLDKVFRMVCPQDIRDAIANTPPGGHADAGNQLGRRQPVRRI